MNNFIVETNTIYVYDGEKLVTCYVLTKTESKIILEESSQGITKEVDITDIQDYSILNEIEVLMKKLRFRKIQYANAQLLSINQVKEKVDLKEYGDTEITKKPVGKYIIRIVRKYYNPKGMLFEKLMGMKWSTKKE